MQAIRTNKPNFLNPGDADRYNRAPSESRRKTHTSNMAAIHNLSYSPDIRVDETFASPGLRHTQSSLVLRPTSADSLKHCVKIVRWVPAPPGDLFKGTPGPDARKSVGPADFGRPLARFFKPYEPAVGGTSLNKSASFLSRSSSHNMLPLESGATLEQHTPLMRTVHGRLHDAMWEAPSCNTPSPLQTASSAVSFHSFSSTLNGSHSQSQRSLRLLERSASRPRTAPLGRHAVGGGIGGGFGEDIRGTMHRQGSSSAYEPRRDGPGAKQRLLEQKGPKPYSSHSWRLVGSHSFGAIG